MKSKQVILCFILFMLVFAGHVRAQGNIHTFQPGQIWPDNHGVAINAHGGGILVYRRTYFWYGEHKIHGPAGNRAMVGVHCYSSTDLYNWKDEGIVLRVSDDPRSPIVKGCIIERPKVIYNAETGKFVMWFHLELKGQGYKAAQTGVAVSDSPTGPFTFLRAVNPDAGHWPLNYTEAQKKMQFADSLKWWTPEWTKAVVNGLFVHRDFKRGQMSRDMTLYVDDDGKAYHIHASEENLTIQISELNDDYTGFTGRYVRVAPAGHNEAPAMFKKDGKYYLITSGCTGWAPNAARSFVADQIMGVWTSLGNPCRGTKEQMTTTFDSQSTYVLKNPKHPDQFIFMADRWRPKDPIDGRYVWLPLQVEDGKPVIRWKDRWTLDNP